MVEKTPLPLTALHEEILQVFDKISLFGGLDKVQTSSLLSLEGQVSYSENEVIFVRGAQPSHIYIVLNGRVRLDFGATDHPLADLHFDAGACFGEA